MYYRIIQSCNIVREKLEEKRKWNMGIIHHKYQADRKEPY